MNKVEENPERFENKYMIRRNVLYYRSEKGIEHWRPVIPRSMENKLITFVHTSLGHAGTDKCLDQIANSMYIKI